MPLELVQQPSRFCVHSIVRNIIHVGRSHAITLPPGWIKSFGQIPPRGVHIEILSDRSIRIVPIPPPAPPPDEHQP